MLRSQLPKAIAFVPSWLTISTVGCVVWAMGSTTTLAAIPTLFMGSRSTIEPALLAQLFKRTLSTVCLIQNCEQNTHQALLPRDAIDTTRDQGEEQVDQVGNLHNLTLMLEQPITHSNGEVVVPGSNLNQSFPWSEVGDRFMAH
jgi:hypothetical protein